MENNKENLKFISEQLLKLKKIFNLSAPNTETIKDYIVNLIDLSEIQLKNSVQNLILSKQNKYYPSIFEIRYNALYNEAEKLFYFLIDIKNKISDKNIEFKNKKVNLFIRKMGGWEKLSNEIENIGKNNFVNLYVSFKI